MRSFNLNSGFWTLPVFTVLVLSISMNYSRVKLVSLLKNEPSTSFYLQTKVLKYCFDWAWHFCIVNHGQMHTRHLVFIHRFFSPPPWSPLTLLQHPLFSICFYLFAHLLRRGSSSSPAGICKLSPQPSPSHSKLFARTATGVVMLRGEPQVFLFDFQDSLFLHSRGWGVTGRGVLTRCVSRSLVCLFIANDRSQGQNCVNILARLPVITDHTDVCIYKPAIHCM